MPSDVLLAPVPGADHREIAGVILDIVQAGAGRVKRAIYPPGFRWSERMKPIVGTDFCMHAHVGFLVRGRIHMQYADGCVVEFAAQCPPEMKIRGGEGKFLFKRATTDLLPESVLTRRKMGFCAPEREWFRGELGEVAAGLITERESACSTYFDVDYIRRKLARHRYIDYSYFLWSLFAFELWHRTFLRGPGDSGLVRF